MRTRHSIIILALAATLSAACGSSSPVAPSHVIGASGGRLYQEGIQCATDAPSGKINVSVYSEHLVIRFRAVNGIGLYNVEIQREEATNGFGIVYADNREASKTNGETEVGVPFSGVGRFALRIRSVNCSETGFGNWSETAFFGREENDPGKAGTPAPPSDEQTPPSDEPSGPPSDEQTPPSDENPPSDESNPLDGATCSAKKKTTFLVFADGSKTTVVPVTIYAAPPSVKVWSAGDAFTNLGDCVSYLNAAGR